MLTFILYAVLFIILGTAAYAGISAAPWVPTKPKQKNRLLEHLDLRDGMTIYDLGCGTGTLLFGVAEKNPNMKAIGYEISFLPFLIAKIRSLKYKNVHIRYANLFQEPIEDANIVLVFLLSKSYKKLWKKFAAELEDDTLVVLEAWPFPRIEPVRTIREEKLLPLFFYQGKQFR